MAPRLSLCGLAIDSNVFQSTRIQLCQRPARAPQSQIGQQTEVAAAVRNTFGVSGNVINQSHFIVPLVMYEVVFIK